MPTGTPPDSRAPETDDEYVSEEPFSLVDVPEPTDEEMVRQYDVYLEMGGEPIEGIEALRKHVEAPPEVEAA